MSDVIAFAAIIISIYCSTVVVKNRTQKDFFMNEYKDFKNEYKEFVSEIRNDKHSSSSIRDTLRQFSGRIKTLNAIVGQEYILNVDELLERHGVFQDEVTAMKSINDQFSQTEVKFSSEEKVIIDKWHQELDKSFLNIIVKLNHANSVPIWDRSDNNWGY